MSIDGYPGLEKLIEVSELDGKLAGIIAEREKLQSNLAKKLVELKKLEVDSARKSAEANAKREQFQKEEKHLKNEQQKLVERRKSLHTLGDYKLQMAAEREINATARQFSEQEDRLIVLMEQADTLEKEAAVLKENYDASKTSCNELQEEVDGTLVTLEEREKDARDKREEIAKTVNASDLKVYNRIAERYAGTTVVPLDNTACSGCFLELGPQILVQLGQGKELIRCRGCGRIIYKGHTPIEE